MLTLDAAPGATIAGVPGRGMVLIETIMSTRSPGTKLLPTAWMPPTLIVTATLPLWTFEANVTCAALAFTNRPSTST